MKELKQKHKEEIQIVDQAEINKQVKFVGQSRLAPGHTMWEWNFIEDTLSPAEMESKAVIVPARMERTLLGGIVKREQRTAIKHKIVIKEGCQYFGALNRKNAIKKIKRSGLHTSLS